MRFREAPVLFSLLLVCFILAAQSAKADTIVFHDLTDTITADGSSRLSVLSCGTGNTAELCVITLSAPSGATISSTTLPAAFLMGETSTLPGTPVSDGLASVVRLSSVLFTFHSDLPENSILPCPPIRGCNVIENGTPQEAGTIHWSDGTTDTIQIQSDLAAATEPEPATLMLFGSGLAIASGFLRRRRRLVTSSSV